ncbi:MAG: AsmA family protein [Alphaproteobacteria bacterium]|nr:AsmA family protein [Alphaproteobacteria bacterium]
MKKQKKKSSFLKRIFKFIMWLIILLIALVIGIYLSLGFIVKKAISTAVPPITGTPASVENVDISLFKGHIGIEGLKVGNPKGFAEENIFELGSIMVDFDLKSILTDKIIIKQIAIKKTKVDAEINKSGDINLTQLQNNVNNYLGTDSSEPKAEAKKETTSSAQSGKKVIIKKLTIDDSTLTLGALGQTIDISLPDIHKTNIGEDKKKQYSVKETIALILSYFTTDSLKAVVNSGSELAKAGLANAKAALNSGIDVAKQAGQNITDGVKNIGSSVTDGIKGLGGMFK